MATPAVGFRAKDAEAFGFSNNQRTARTLDVIKYGDTLMASIYGTKAMITGDMSLSSIQRDASTMPEPMRGHPILSNAEAKQKFKTAKRCGSSNVPCEGEQKAGGDSYAIAFSKEGDVTVYSNPEEYLQNITNEDAQDIDASYRGGQMFFGSPTQPDSGVLGEQYEQTPASFLPDWLEDLFKNDCASVCAEFEGEAKRLCMNDCEKSNEGLGLSSSIGKWFIVAGLILAGIAVLYAGLTSISRGGD